MTDAIPPRLLDSPAFLLIALLAAHTTSDKPLERLAAERLDRMGISVQFRSKSKSRKAEAARG